MESKMPLVEKQPSEWKQCCYNYFLLLITPVSLLAIFVTPIQLFARYLPADSFALFVLVFSIGIGWNQIHAFIRSCRTSTKNSMHDSAFYYFVSIAYELISLALAIAACSFALGMIHKTCPQNAPFKPIRSCFSSECSYLYITSTACYYWYIAIPIIELSMKIFNKFAIQMDASFEDPQRVLSI